MDLESYRLKKKGMSIYAWGFFGIFHFFYVFNLLLLPYLIQTVSISWNCGTTFLLLICGLIRVECHKKSVLRSRTVITAHVWIPQHDSALTLWPSVHALAHAFHLRFWRLYSSLPVPFQQSNLENNYISNFWSLSLIFSLKIVSSFALKAFN